MFLSPDLRLQPVRSLGRTGLVLLVLSGVTPVESAASVSSDPGRPLRVATAQVAPFVFKDGDRLSGFSVDLWNAVALRAGLQFSWTVVSTPSEVLESVQRGDADVGIAALAITPQREHLVDFSHPYFNSGLQIMVRAQSDSAFADTIRTIPWVALGKLSAAGILIVFLLANLLWVVERRSNPDAKNSYLPGMREALWGTMLIIATGEHGDRNAPGALKRLTVVGMWLLGVLLIAQLTATVTSTQTVQRLRSRTFAAPMT